MLNRSRSYKQSVSICSILYSHAHLQALAVAVDEKTQLQAQLRGAVGDSRSLQHELELLRANATAAAANESHSMHVGAQQYASLQAEAQQLFDKCAHQSALLAAQRKELGESEAKLVVLNQDKNDVQVR